MQTLIQTLIAIFEVINQTDFTIVCVCLLPFLLTVNTCVIHYYLDIPHR